MYICKWSILLPRKWLRPLLYTSSYIHRRYIIYYTYKYLIYRKAVISQQTICRSSINIWVLTNKSSVCLSMATTARSKSKSLLVISMPIPPLAPVTNATLPFQRFISVVIIILYLWNYKNRKRISKLRLWTLCFAQYHWILFNGKLIQLLSL